MFWRALKWIINSKIAQFIGVLLASLAVVKGAKIKWKHDGKKQEREAQAKEAEQARQNARKQSNAVTDQVGDMHSDDVKRVLSDKWSSD